MEHKYIMGRQLMGVICEALGITEKRVQEIRITANVRDVVLVEVMMVGDTRLRDIAWHNYSLVERPKEDDQNDALA